MTFEYDITRFPAEAFERLAIFCSEKGECALDDVPMDQTRLLEDFLNEKGAEGWELVQLFFHTSGVVAIWKRLKN
ncbi:MAG: DUF4177 domain-containing protein [Deltaproteobacteria bacterium]|nr:DUF4177 domain-containing protein [Deltaproteobacteria bacterium]